MANNFLGGDLRKKHPGHLWCHIGPEWTLATAKLYPLDGKGAVTTGKNSSILPATTVVVLREIQFLNSDIADGTTPITLEILDQDGVSLTVDLAGTPTTSQLIFRAADILNTPTRRFTPNILLNHRFGMVRSDANTDVLVTFDWYDSVIPQS